MSDPTDDAAFKRAMRSSLSLRPTYMKPGQAAELRRLCQTANEDLYREELSEAEASTLIDRLREKLL